MKTWTAKDGTVMRSLTFEESIRMNAMIQNGVDIEGFRAWYGELTRPEQSALSSYLFNVYVCEQHYSEGFEVFKQALARAGLTLNDPLVQSFLSGIRGYEPDQGFTEPSRPSEKWINSLEDAEHKKVFELCVYSFGIHEGNRFLGCAGSCTHWWHQDLNDPKVVEELIRAKRKNSPTAAPIPPAPKKNNSKTFFRKFFGLK